MSGYSITILTKGNLPAFRAWAEGQHRIGWDVEASGTDPHAPGFVLTHLSVGAESGTAWVVDAAETDLLREVARIIAEHPRAAAHNASYDVAAVAAVVGVWLGRTVDTLVLARDAWPGEPCGLKALRPATQEALEALRGRWEAATGKAARGKAWLAEAVLRLPFDDPVLLHYSASDAVEAARLAEQIDALWSEHPPTGARERENAGRDLRLERAWWVPSYRGYRIDTDLLTEMEGELAALRESAATTLGLDVGSNSKAVRDWVAGLGITGLPVSEKSGEMSLSASTLDQAVVPEESAPAWATFRQVREGMSVSNTLRTLRSSLDARGRLHPHLAINGADATGRMSSTSPNVQNISDALKQLFLAEEGHTLVGLDLDRIEPCVVAVLSEDDDLVAATQPGQDVYLELARTVWPDRGLTKGSPERARAKTAFLASIYGQGARSLSRSLGITVEEAREVLDGINRGYPRFAKWRRGVQADAERNVHPLFSPAGRILPAVPDAPYKAVNYMVQGTAAAIFKIGTERVVDRLGAGALYLPVHDELVVQVPVGEEGRACAVLEECMTGEILGVNVQGQAEVLGPSLRHA